ncbi:MAG: putative metal-binding motif-containing protein [Deltaproteobacteria bacterium]|nr:putative metal-binding motif-containing protein [Deltaproteobacteria bacterium]
MRHALILSLACFTLAACKGDDTTTPDETGVPATDSDAPTDNDGDGSPEGEDCDDDDAAVNPDATELCDGLDNNCDGETDEGVKTTAYTDADGDGFGDDSTAAETCEVPDGSTTLGGDCDDTDPSYNPGAAETECDDPNDYNCDGSVGYADNDSDGFAACQECDDNDAAVNPSAAEDLRRARQQLRRRHRRGRDDHLLRRHRRRWLR